MTIAGDEQHSASRLTELSRLDVDNITLTLLSGGREERLAQVIGDVRPSEEVTGQW